MPDLPVEDPVEDVAHVSLLAGRLLLANGADTTEVLTTVTRLAAAFGCGARLVVTYEALLLTLVADGRFHTRAGRHLPGMAVNLGAVQALHRIVEDAAGGRLAIAEVRDALHAVETGTPGYPRPLVALTLGLTAACLATLFGGDWIAFGVALVAGSAGTWVRLALGRRGFNPFAVAFVTALASGVIGGLGVRLLTTTAPALCLVAPGMIIVPGVPLINGCRDIIRNHMTLGLARLASAGIAVLAIALGLFAAATVTGVQIPVGGSAVLLPIPVDALFSALAVAGFMVLFNVPVRLGWACAVCGLCSHALRTGLMTLGLDIATGTLLGALAVGLLSQIFARSVRAPPATFAFPGVVAMIPGAYGFRAVIGCLQIFEAGAGASPALVADTASLIITTGLLVAAIALGMAAPLALPDEKP